MKEDRMLGMKGRSRAPQDGAFKKFNAKEHHFKISPRKGLQDKIRETGLQRQ